jgi:hypothetical protein
MASKAGVGREGEEELSEDEKWESRTKRDRNMSC